MGTLKFERILMFKLPPLSQLVLLTLLPLNSNAFVHTPWSEQLYQYLGNTYDSNVKKRALHLQDDNSCR